MSLAKRRCLKQVAKQYRNYKTNKHKTPCTKTPSNNKTKNISFLGHGAPQAPGSRSQKSVFLVLVIFLSFLFVALVSRDFDNLFQTATCCKGHSRILGNFFRNTTFCKGHSKLNWQLLIFSFSKKHYMASPIPPTRFPSDCRAFENALKGSIGDSTNYVSGSICWESQGPKIASFWKPFEGPLKAFKRW